MAENENWKLKYYGEHEEGFVMTTLTISYLRRTIGAKAWIWRAGGQLGAQVCAVADDVRACVLRYRDDCDGRRPFRHRPFRRGRLSPKPTAERSGDYRGHCDFEDGAGGAPRLRSDA